MVDASRSISLNEKKEANGPVVYWMSRDMRTTDNWALLYALDAANKIKKPLWVVFTLSPSFLSANLRHYHFLLEGLKEVEISLAEPGIGFQLLLGEPPLTILSFLNDVNAGVLVSDFDPLRIKWEWKSELNKVLNIAHYQVDAHNIVPCWVASQKQEFGAYTLRPKVKRLLPNYLSDFPQFSSPLVRISSKPTPWEKVMKLLNPDDSVKPVSWIKPGQKAAANALQHFVSKKLNEYSLKRNDPTLDAQSNLSPYIHFGHISAQRIAIETLRCAADEADKSAFLEELIVRRELSDNFCYYNPNYDSISGIHPWAKVSLEKHSGDEREFIYSLEQFEMAKTHDELWNAAQLQMVKTGKMHGYMRMYWAKKILEWTPSPAVAMQHCIYLNDKYSLDGRDPNGYAGIAWSIGGIHDRAWSERPVFGKIRYMNYNGCKRKFDVEGYVSMVGQL